MKREAVKVTPSKWFFFLGAMVIVAGVVIMIAVAVNGAMSVLNDGKKADIPGKSLVQLDKTGPYDIVYASSSTLQTVTDTSPFAGMTFTLTDPSGNQIGITKAGGSVMKFTADKTGTYTLTVAYSSGSGASGSVLILPTGGLNSALVGVLFWALVIAGVLIIIVTAVLRHKNRAKLYVQ